MKIEIKEIKKKKQQQQPERRWYKAEMTND